MTKSQSGGLIACAATAAVVASTVTYLIQKNRQKKDEGSWKQIPQELQTGQYSREMRLAVKLALQAGKNMMPHYNGKGTVEHVDDLNVSFKGKPIDFATKIDLENEKLIGNAIRSAYPNHEIIGEEDVGTGSIPPLTNKPTWILDPIDGTTNFASGLPLSCVSIGLCDDGRPVMGVVFAPMTNELYLAIRGRGAYRNGIQIDPATDEKKTLSDAVVDFEFGYATSDDAIKKMVGAVQRIVKHGCRTTRSLGSGVLDLVYVASGRLDVVYTGVASGEDSWKPWDYCAGTVIALESGCSIETLDQSPDVKEFDIYTKSHICAANKKLLEECRKVVLNK